MDDLISRRAAIELLCRALHYAYSEDYAVTLVLNLPSAQSEVIQCKDFIRCKDCRHWGRGGLCGIWDYYISNEGFYCGCAERRK